MAKSDKAKRLAALREKLENTDTGGSRGGGYWRPSDGVNLIRILPEVGDMEFFFQCVGTHWINENKIYCPEFTSEKELPCPICERVHELYKAGDPASKDLAGSIRVQKKYWMNIVDRNNEDAGVQTFTPGPMIFDSLVSIFNDPDYGDITDIDEGFDIKIDRSGKGINTSYEVRPVRHESPLHEDEKVVDEWLDAARDMTYTVLSNDPEEDAELQEGYSLWILPYERVEEEFEKILAGESLDDSDEDYDDDPEPEEPEEVDEPEEEDEVGKEVQKRTARRRPRRK